MSAQEVSTIYTRYLLNESDVIRGNKNVDKSLSATIGNFNTLTSNVKSGFSSFVKGAEDSSLSISQIESRIKELDSKLKSTDIGSKRFQILSNAVTEAKKELDNLLKPSKLVENSIAGISAKVMDLEGKLRNASVGSKTFQTLAKEVSDAKSKLSDANRELEKLNKTTNTNANSISGLNDRLRDLENKLGKVEIGSKRFQVLGQAVSDTKDKIGQVNSELSQLSNRSDGVASSIKNIAAAFAVGFAVSSFTGLLGKSMDAAQKAENTYRGVAAVVEYNFGTQAVPKAINAVENLSKELNLNKDSIAAAIRNFTSMGYTVDQATNLIKAHADVGSVLRQQNYSLAESIDVASQGYKNQNSQLSDATGVQTNISLMLEKHGLKMEDLSKSTKKQTALQALYNETLKEAEAFQGQALKNTEGYAGATGLLDKNVTQLQINLGKLYKDILTPLISELAKGAGALSNFTSNMSPATSAIIAAVTATALLLGGILALYTTLQFVAPQMMLSFTAMLGPIGLVTAAILTLSAATVGLTVYLDKMTEANTLETENFAKGSIAIADNTAKLQKLKDAYSAVNEIRKQGELTPTSQSSLKSLIPLLSDAGVRTERYFRETGNGLAVVTQEWEALGLAIDRAGQNSGKPKRKDTASLDKEAIAAALKEEKRLADVWLKEHPYIAEIAFDPNNLSLGPLQKEFSELSKNASIKPLIPVGLDISKLGREEILSKLKEISDKTGIKVKALLNEDPKSIGEIIHRLEALEQDPVISKNAKIKIRLELDRAKSEENIQSIIGVITKQEQSWQNLTGPLTASETLIGNIVKQTVRIGETSGVTQFVASWKMASQVLGAVSQSVSQFFQAQAQAAQVHFQNLNQNLNFYNQLYSRITDDNLQRTLSAYQTEMDSLALQREEMDRIDEEYFQRKEDRRNAEKERITRENEEKYNADVVSLTEEYNRRIEQLRQSTTDEELFNLKKAELFEELQNRKDQLKKQYDDRTENQVRESEGRLTNEETKREKEKSERDKKNADEVKNLEKSKADATKKAEEEKSNAQKLSSLISYRAGFVSFQANQQAQLMNAKFSIANAIMQGVVAATAAFAGMVMAGSALAVPTLGASVPTYIALGSALAATVGGIVSAMAIGTGVSQISTIGAMKYPPWTGFATGGFSSEPAIFGEDGLELAIPMQKPGKDFGALKAEIADRLLSGISSSVSKVSNFTFNNDIKIMSSLDPRAIVAEIKDTLLHEFKNATAGLYA